MDSQAGAKPTSPGWSSADPGGQAMASSGSGWSGLRPTANLNVDATELLDSPAAVRAELPQTQRANQTVVAGRQSVCQILSRSDRRMLMIVGPCSIHDVDAAMEYAQRLARLKHQLIDRMFIVMRVYFEKPRTTVGWKGMLNDPDLNGSFDISRGLRNARKLLIGILELGLPTATEVLDPIIPQYLSDLISWAAIGARTTESQTHRQMASGLSMPVGFKNGTDGNLQVAIDAMQASRQPHAFLGVDDHGKLAVVKTRGNPWGHVILRGGRKSCNFDPQAVQRSAELLQQASLPTNLIIDCSHANAQKQWQNQPIVWRSVVSQRVAGDENLVGMMLESHLHEGNQKLTDDPSQLKYGVSITDPCVNWQQTEELLLETYQQLG